MKNILLILIILLLNSCKDLSPSSGQTTPTPTPRPRPSSSTLGQLPDYDKVLSERFFSEKCSGVQFGAAVACLRNDTGLAAPHFNAPMISIYAGTPQLNTIKQAMLSNAIAIRFDKSFLPLIKLEIREQLKKYADKSPVDIFLLIQSSPEEEVAKGCQLLVHDWAFFDVKPEQKNYGLPAANRIQRNLYFAVFEIFGSVIKKEDNSDFITDKMRLFDVHYHDKKWSPDNRRIVCAHQKNMAFWSLVVDHDKSAITLHWLVDMATMEKFIDIFWEGKDPSQDDPRKLRVREWLKEAIKKVPNSPVWPSLYSLIPQNKL